jgi:hypothetical protein
LTVTVSKKASIGARKVARAAMAPVKSSSSTASARAGLGQRGDQRSFGGFGRGIVRGGVPALLLLGRRMLAARL